MCKRIYKCVVNIFVQALVEDNENGDAEEREERREMDEDEKEAVCLYMGWWLVDMCVCV